MTKISAPDEADSSQMPSSLPSKPLPTGLVKPGRRAPSPAEPMNLDGIFAAVDEHAYDADDPDDQYVDQRHATSTFSLELQSRDAQHAWLGRPHTKERRGTPGIEWFCRKVGRLCRGARDDDPYAIMALSAIEHQLNSLRMELAQNTQRLETSLKSGESFGFTFKQPSLKSFSPLQYAVNPANGYAFAACEMLARYDRVVTLSLEARNLKLVNKLEFSQIRSRRPFSRLVQTLIGYRYSGATRTDFLHETQRAVEAVEKFGPVDALVLEPDTALLLMDIDPMSAPDIETPVVDPVVA